MPRYEFTLLLRHLEKVDTVSALKKLVSHVINKGNVVRNIHSLGTKSLPVNMGVKEDKHTHGTYILLDVNCPKNEVQPIKAFFRNDTNVIRTNAILHEEVYFPEPHCDGWTELDYGKMLDDLKANRKYQTKLRTHPYVN